MGLPSTSGIVSPLGLLASAAAAGVFLIFFTPLLPAVKKYFLRSSTLRRLKHANFIRVGTVKALNVYPVKSAKGIPLTSLHCGPFGVTPTSSSPLLDRGWLVIFGDSNRFVTMRQEPTLVLISASFDEGSHSLTLSAPRMSSITFPTPFSASTAGSHMLRRTKVFGVATSGLDCGDDVADWLSRFLGKPGHRLIFKAPASTERARDLSDTIPYTDFEAKPDLKYRHIAYQDEAPVLVTNSQSLASLNGQLEAPIGMERFRPNIVVEGSAAWEEDRWEHLAFCRRDIDPNRDSSGMKTVLRRVTPSARCKVPTVDPETGVMDPEEEPLRTLKSFHPWASFLGGESDSSFRAKAVFGNCMGIVIEGGVDEGDHVWALTEEFIKKE